MGDLTVWIHADENRAELRQLHDILEADVQIDASASSKLVSNTFSMKITEKEWLKQPIRIGHFVYCPQTEYGGIVTLLKHTTGRQEITLEGVTWRGMLYQKVIEPPAGSAYWAASNVEANALISLALNNGYGTLFAVSQEDTGVHLSASWRYDTLGEALTNLLAENGLRLEVVYDNVTACVMLAACPVNDISGDLEVSQDYGITFTSTKGCMEYANHCIALGEGELDQRQVMHVYHDGKVFSTVLPAGWTQADLRTIVLDYGNAESSDDLFLAACEELRNHISTNGVEIDETKLMEDCHLLDLVVARDRLTGFVAFTQITGKVLKIANGVLSVTMNTGSERLGDGNGYAWQTLKMADWNMLRNFRWQHLLQS